MSLQPCHAQHPERRNVRCVFGYGHAIDYHFGGASDSNGNMGFRWPIGGPGAITEDRILLTEAGPTPTPSLRDALAATLSDADDMFSSDKEAGGRSIFYYSADLLLALLVQRGIICEHGETEIERLRAIVDSPDPRNFIAASEAEARFQKMEWTSDGGKSDADWFWLIGYLAGKALHNPGGDTEKRLHRITTIAAAAANWHAAVLGDDSMRPGMSGPALHKAQS